MLLQRGSPTLCGLQAASASRLVNIRFQKLDTLYPQSSGSSALSVKPYFTFILGTEGLVYNFFLFVNFFLSRQAFSKLFPPPLFPQSLKLFAGVTPSNYHKIHNLWP